MAKKTYLPTMEGRLEEMYDKRSREDVLALGEATPAWDATTMADEDSFLMGREEFVPEPEPDTSFLNQVGQSMILNDPLQGIATLIQGETYFKPDPTYKPSEYADQLMEGIPADYEDEVLNQPTSLEDAIRTRNKVMKELAVTQEIMGDNFATGMAAMMGGYMLNPANLMLNAGAARALNLAKNMTRAQRAAAAATIEGSIGAAETTLQAQNMETMDGGDVAFATAVSAGMGGAMGMMFKGADVPRDILDDAAAVDRMAHVHGQNTAESLTNPNRQMQPEEGSGQTSVLGRTAEDDLIAHEVAMDDYTAMSAVGIPADLPVPPKPVPTVDRILTEAADRDAAGLIQKAGAFGDKWIGKMIVKNPFMTDAARIGNTNAATPRMYMTEFLENASGIGGRLVNKTAAMMKSTSERRLLGQFQPSYTRGFESFKADRGVGRLSPRAFGEVQEEFNFALRQEMEARRTAIEKKGGRYESTAPDYIQKAADDIDAMTKRGLEEMQSAGVHGASEIKHVSGYIPLKWNISKVGSLTPVARKAYQKLLSDSYANMGIDAKSANTIARAVFDRASVKHLDIDSNPGRLFSQDSRDFLELMLKDSGINQAEVTSILRRIDGSLSDKGKPKGMRARVSVDLNATHGEYKLLDLVNNDLNTLLSRHASETSGRAALAMKGITRDTEWQSLRAAMSTDMQNSGDGAVRDKVLRSFDQTYDEFLGRPISGGHNKWARRLMDWTTTARLGQVGIAQFAEMNNLVASQGFLTVLREVPTLMKVHSQLKAAAKSGDYSKLDKPFMRELMVMGGSMWDEHLLYRTGVRLNDAVGGAIDDPSWATKTLGHLDAASASSMDALGYVSGLYKMKAMQQQMSVMLQTQRFVDLASKGGSGKASLMKRMKEVGLDEKAFKRIEKELKHVEYSSGKVVNRLNLEKWSPSVREEFITALHRHTNQVIQLPMIGERSMYQSSTFGAMLMQFKTFSTLALEKQAARHAGQFDGEAFAAVTYGMAFSSAAYFGKVMLNAQGRPDKDEYLKERLTWQRAAEGMTAYASALAPVNTALNVADDVGLLRRSGSSRGRAKGLDQRMPSVGYALKALNAIREPSKLLHGEEANWQRAALDTYGLLPLSNTLPGTAIANGIRTIIPEKK